MNIDDGGDIEIRMYNSKWKCGLKTELESKGGDFASAGEYRRLLACPCPRVG
jgi:hypothetical protein